MAFYLDNPILVLGSTGQIGSALMQELGKSAVGLSRPEVDFAQPHSLVSVLNRYQPSAVINAAAYTQVDQAEKEESLAFTINAISPGMIAKWCHDRDIPFIHYSTDYVFPGSGTVPWREDDETDPVNTYGKSKLEGERKIAESPGKWIILRTSWVYDASGKNFLRTILRLAQEKEQLRIVADQWGAPSFAKHLAVGTLQILRQLNDIKERPSSPWGIYHFCNQGVTNWHGFAVEIIRASESFGYHLKVKKIEPIASSEFQTLAKRPCNSRLNMDKLKETFDLSMPDWKMALYECLESMK